MNYKILVISFTIISLFCSCVTTRDVREKLMDSAIIQDPDFPKGEFVKSTQFAYIGKVNTIIGNIYVVDTKAVLTNMPAPRGVNRLLFFDKSFNFLGALDRRIWHEPLWCEDGKLFFFGFSEDQLYDSTGKTYKKGNALYLKEGWLNRKMVEIKEYGSYGGTIECE